MIPVSICVTAWNRASQISATLESLLAQDFGDFELIISDDCSADATEEVCRGFARKDRRIKYFRNERNLNMPGNLNAAVGRAQGRYVANLHDGDVFRPDLISKWKAALDRFPRAAFVFNDYEVTLPDGKKRIDGMPFAGEVPGRELALHYFKTVTSCIWGTVMVRSSAYAKALPFDPQFGYISDVDMWLRLAHDDGAVYVPEPLLCLGPRPTDHPFRHGLWKQMIWSFQIYLRHLERYKDQLPHEVEEYKRRYPRTLRRQVLRTLAYCFRVGNWERLKEGMSLCRDADSRVLRLVGMMSRERWKPEWYPRGAWMQARPLSPGASS